MDNVLYVLASNCMDLVLYVLAWIPTCQDFIGSDIFGANKGFVCGFLRGHKIFSFSHSIVAILLSDSQHFNCISYLFWIFIPLTRRRNRRGLKGRVTLYAPFLHPICVSIYTSPSNNGCPPNNNNANCFLSTRRLLRAVPHMPCSIPLHRYLRIHSL